MEESNEELNGMKARQTDNSNLPSSNLLVNDVNIKIRYQIGDEIEDGVSCNSVFVISAMDHVRLVICKASNWIKSFQNFYLMIDNAAWYKQCH